MSKHFTQGRFKPTNPEKYKGNPTNVVFRSSWERLFMVWADRTSAVIEWSSEEVVVPYICATDNKQHRYFIDFYIKVKDLSGIITKYLVEIKPRKETIPPRKSANKIRYITECLTFSKNQSKWKAAEAYATKRDMKFIILDEYHLGIKTSQSITVKKK